MIAASRTTGSARRHVRQPSTFAPLLVTLASGVLALLGSPAAAQDGRAIAIHGGTVLPISGPAITGGTVLIRDGRIAAVGESVPIPADAERVDATGRFVMPGLIDAMTYYGIDAADLNETASPVTPELRVIEAYYPFGRFGSGTGDLSAADLIAGGVTTQYIAPADRTVVGGMGAVVKNAAPSFDGLVLREPAAMDITLGGQPASTFRARQRSPSTRVAVVSQLRDALVRAQEYAERRNAREALSERERATTAPPARDRGMEALGRLLRREFPARIQANRTVEIRVAMELAEEFGFDLVIDGGASAHEMRRELAARQIPVVLGPVTHPFISGEEIPDRDEYPAPDERSAAWLTEAGVKVAFGSFSRGLGNLAQGVTGKWILIDAAIASGYGLAEDRILRALTLDAAEILGVADRVGSLEPGKDADIIILDGHPLSVRTWVERAYVDGRLVYERPR